MRKLITSSLAAIVLASTLSACNLGTESVADPSVGVEETLQPPVNVPEPEATAPEVVTDQTEAPEPPVFHDPTEAPAPLN